MADESERSIPPWDAPAHSPQPLQEPLQLGDGGVPVDVAQFVRFELNHNDIRYGVLDLTVQFSYRGSSTFSL